MSLALKCLIISVLLFITDNSFASEQPKPVLIVHQQDTVKQNLINPLSTTSEIKEQTAIEAEEDNIDDLLNAMEKDGTFEVKPVSPFMIFLRGIGGHLLINYIAFKELLQRWTERLFHHQNQPVLTVSSNNNQPMAETHENKE